MNRESAEAPLLVLQDVSKAFGGLQAVNKVSFGVISGHVMGLIGPNGAGKTTLFNLITGYLRPDSGQIELGHESVFGLPPYEVAQRGIARTFQHGRLFRNNTVLENVMMGMHLQFPVTIIDAVFGTRGYRRRMEQLEAQARDLLEQGGIVQWADHLAGSLPYGVQRRLEIVRALALKPRILMLDEPAAGLNPPEVDELTQFIRELNARGYTVVVIEHHMNLVMNVCDHIAVLNYGTKIAEGTPKEIQSHPDVVKAYLGQEAQ